MPENPQLSRCATCGGPSTLLCDGRIYTLPNGRRFRVPMGWPNGSTTSCDAHVCRGCAQKLYDIHLNMGRNGCRWDTRDLCPLCQQAQQKPQLITP